MATPRELQPLHPDDAQTAGLDSILQHVLLWPLTANLHYPIKAEAFSI